MKNLNSHLLTGHLKNKILFFVYFLLLNVTYSQHLTENNTLKKDKIDTIKMSFNDSLVFTNFYTKKINMYNIDDYYYNIDEIDSCRIITSLDTNLLKNKLKVESKFNKEFVNYLIEETIKKKKIQSKIGHKKRDINYYENYKKGLNILHQLANHSFYLIGKIQFNKNYKSIIYLLQNNQFEGDENKDLYLINYNKTGVLSIYNLSNYITNIFYSSIYYTEIFWKDNRPYFNLFSKSLSSDNINPENDEEPSIEFLCSFFIKENGFFTTQKN